MHASLSIFNHSIIFKISNYTICFDRCILAWLLTCRDGLTDSTLRCSRYASGEHRLPTVQIGDLTAVELEFDFMLRRNITIEKHSPCGVSVFLW